MAEPNRPEVPSRTARFQNAVASMVLTGFGALLLLVAISGVVWGDVRSIVVIGAIGLAVSACGLWLSRAAWTGSRRP